MEDNVISLPSQAIVRLFKHIGSYNDDMKVAILTNFYGNVIKTINRNGCNYEQAIIYCYDEMAATNGWEDKVNE